MRAPRIPGLIVFGAMAVLAAVVFLGGAAQAAIIETVPVGNAGNDADFTGYGAVGYAYQIGKYEVTAGQYTEFLNKVGGVDPYSLYNTTMSQTDFGSGITRSGGGTVGDPYTYTVATDFVNRPVNCVSFWDAARFVNWLHNGQPAGAQGPGTTESGAYTLNGYNGSDGRSIVKNAGARYWIPSENEWYKAAYHQNNGVTDDYFIYPTASNSAPGQDMSDATGNNANRFTDPIHTYPIDGTHYTTTIGEFQSSDSPYGTFDQGGNVAEWNDTLIDIYQGNAVRGVRGGAFICDSINADLTSSNRYYIESGMTEGLTLERPAGVMPIVTSYCVHGS